MNARPCRLTLVPVMNPSDKKALEHSRACMINPKYPFTSPKDITVLASKEMVFSDSTGYQALLAFPTARRVVLGLVARPRNAKGEAKDEVLFLNPLYNCQENTRTHTTTGFLVDYPTIPENVPDTPMDSDEVYDWKLRMSQKARDLTLPLAARLCPETDLAIALQPRFMDELESYFDAMSVPEVKMYGFPTRSKGPLEIAYVLSFLHSRGVTMVHMLGSSAAIKIMVLAAAAGLGMFDRITFDSNTWQAYFGGKRHFLDHETLRRMPRRGNKPGKMFTDARLKLLLDEYGGDFDRFLAGLEPPEDATVKEWVGIYNIRVIESFAGRMLHLARENTLADYVEDCWLPQKRKTEVLQAIEMLRISAEQGHAAAVDFYDSPEAPEARKTA